MSSRLSADELVALQPVLGSIAQLIAGGWVVDEQQVQKLLRAADLAPEPERVREMLRAAEILVEARQSAAPGSKQVAVASLRLRGWLEAPAQAAVNIVAGVGATPEPIQAQSSLTVYPECLELSAPAGQPATAAIQVSGSPGIATCDSDRVTITPSRFSAGYCTLNITVQSSGGSPLVWTSLLLTTAAETVRVPIVVQWDEPVVVTPVHAEPPKPMAVQPAAQSPTPATGGPRRPAKIQALPVTPAYVPSQPTSTLARNPASHIPATFLRVFGALVVVGAIIWIVQRVSTPPPAPAPLAASTVLPFDTPAISTALPPTSAQIAQASSVATETPPTEAPPTEAPPTEPPPTATQTPLPQFSVYQNVYVRSGPGGEYPSVGQLNLGQIFEILQRTEDGSWLEFGYGDQRGWVRQDVVRIEGDLGSVPVASDLPPPPPPTATPTPPGPAMITFENLNRLSTTWSVEGQSPFENPRIAVSPDGLKLATASEDKDSAGIRIWSLRDGQLLSKIPLAERASPIVFSPDGSLLAAGLWDLTVRVWSTSDGRQVQVFADHTTIPAALAFSPDGAYLASGGDYGGPGDGALIVWNTRDWTVAAKQSGSWGAIRSLAFSANAGLLAGGMMDGKTRVFAPWQGFAIFQVVDGNKDVRAVTFSPDSSQLAYGGVDQKVNFMRTSDSSLAGSLPGYPSYVNAIAYSPDGSLLAAGTEDGRIFISRLNSAEAPRILLGHSERVVDVAFSPDGAFLVSGGWDNRARIWGIK